MKNIDIHHIHVRFGKDIFTISHSGDCIPLGELGDIFQNILQVCKKKFYNDKIG